MKKSVILRTAAALLAAVSLCFLPAEATSARHAIVMDGQTGKVLYEKNATARSLVASCTKIMTALLVCQQTNVLDPVQIPKEAVGVEGSSMYLQAGEVLAVQELLYGLMLCSGNDAAVALAIHCAGSVEAFAQQMNQKAQELGLDGTHFVNPHGLDAPEHYSTARDLAVLAAYAMKNPIFAQTVSTQKVTVGNRYLTNHNKLLWQVDGADGVKTGYTKAAGRILVSTAVQQGRRLVCVTVDDPNDWADHKAFYQQFFPRYATRQLVQAGDILGTRSIVSGREDQVDLVASEDFSFALAEGETLQICLENRPFVYAPVCENGYAGRAFILVDGKVVGAVAVHYGKTVEQQVSPKRSWWEKIFGEKKK